MYTTLTDKGREAFYRSYKSSIKNPLYIKSNVKTAFISHTSVEIHFSKTEKLNSSKELLQKCWDKNPLFLNGG